MVIDLQNKMTYYVTKGAVVTKNINNYKEGKCRHNWIGKNLIVGETWFERLKCTAKI